MMKKIFVIATAVIMFVVAVVDCWLSMSRNAVLSPIQLENLEAVASFGEWWDKPVWDCYRAKCNLWLCWDCTSQKAKSGSTYAHSWDCGCNGF